MLLSTQDLRNYGLRIDEGVSDEHLSESIVQAEDYYLRQMIGNDAYMSLIGVSLSDPSMSGGIVDKADGTKLIIEGLARAIAHIAFSCLLRNNINATAFGSTQKKDEYSTQVDPWREAKRHYEMGRAWVREYCEWKGIKIRQMEF